MIGACDQPQAGDHLDTVQIGQAEVDQREIELQRADQAERVVHARRFGDLGVREHLVDQHLQPGADLGQVLEQQDVLHGESSLGARRLRGDDRISYTGAEIFYGV